MLVNLKGKKLLSLLTRASYMGCIALVIEAMILAQKKEKVVAWVYFLWFQNHLDFLDTL